MTTLRASHRKIRIDPDGNVGIRIYTKNPKIYELKSNDEMKNLCLKIFITNQDVRKLINLN